MEVAELTLDFIAAMKWPVMIVALVGFLVWQYHDLLGTLVKGLSERTETLTTPVGSATFATNQQADAAPEAPVAPPTSEQRASTAAGLGAEDDPGAPPASERPASTTASLEAELVSLRSERDGLAESFQRANHALYAEQVYRLIFGSQVELLRALNNAPVGLGANDLQKFYAAYLRGASRVTWTFNEYIAFPIRAELVEQPDPNTNHYVIAPNGRYFLSYVVEQGLPPKDF